MRADRLILLAPVAAVLLLASCASFHLHKGEKAMGLMAYAKAEKHFTKALEHKQDRQLLLQTALAEFEQNKVKEATAHYAAADSLAPLAGEDAFRYGRLLMGEGRYTEAEPLLVRALQDRPEHSDIAVLIGACQGYRSFYADSSRYSVSPLQLPGLTAAYSPTPFGNGLLFVGQRDAAAGRDDPWSGLSFADLYTVSIAADGATGVPQPLESPVNGSFHEGSAVVADSGRTLYFTRSNYYGGRKLQKDKNNMSNLKLFRATVGADGKWGNIHEFGYNKDTYSVGAPSLSHDGKTLYFTSDMPGGHGGKDIWYSTDNGTGWGQPVNMGHTINSSGDEMFPSVVGDAFYFSSTGHNNMGGLDIFATHREGEYWSEPKNMGYPVNSTRDDFGLWLDSTGTHGFLSSSRSGMDRIYALNMQPPTFDLEISVTDAASGEPVPYAIVTLSNIVDLMHVQDTADAQGHFHYKLEPGSAYTVTTEKEGMMRSSTFASTIGLGVSTTLHANLKLNALVLGKPIVVPNIYYDYDKWNIRPDAAVELDKLAKLFQDNPGLTFELSAHTDSRGGDMYNLVLSDARAKSAVDYLVRQGVPYDQLIARGYGETEPVNGCVNGVQCTEEQHQANRRTEFRVVSEDTAAP